MILNLLKRAWPVLRLFGRSPVDRATFRTLPNGNTRTIPNGEVRTLP